MIVLFCFFIFLIKPFEGHGDTNLVTSLLVMNLDNYSNVKKLYFTCLQCQNRFSGVLPERVCKLVLITGEIEAAFNWCTLINHFKLIAGFSSVHSRSSGCIYDE